VANEFEIHEVIDQMRTAIPKQIRQAERVNQERDRIVAQAEEEAGRIIRLAHEEALKQVDDHEMIRTANLRAQTVLERAQREAETLRGDADEYARGVLATLDEQLGSLEVQIGTVLSTVRNGLQTLAKNRQTAIDE